MAKKSTGRMINVSISLSARVSSLSPESLSLFCMLIPHYNAHGKMLANPHLIKGLVCPLIEWMTPDVIDACLNEISEKTSVKYWQDEKGLHYLHCLNWFEHQTLKTDRLGPDHLPSWQCTIKNPISLSGSSPGVVRECSHKGKGREVEVKEEGEGEGEGKIIPPPMENKNLLALFFALKSRQPNSFEMCDLAKIQDNYSREEIEYAFSEAGRSGANLRYVLAVLEGRGKKKEEKPWWHGIEGAEEQMRGDSP